MALLHLAHSVPCATNLFTSVGPAIAESSPERLLLAGSYSYLFGSSIFVVSAQKVEESLQNLHGGKKLPIY